MKIRHILGVLVAGGLAAGAVWTAMNWKDLKPFPSIISSYYAKEMCSCLYVVGQTEERCHDIVRQWVPISSYHNNVESKAVTVSGLGKTNRAYFTGERYGCVLEPLD